MPAASRWLKPLASILFVSAIFIVLAREIVKAELDLQILGMRQNWIHWLTYLGLMLAVQFLLVFGWRSILSIHSVRAPFGRILYAFSIPNLGKYVPGKVLFVLGRVELTCRLGVTRMVGLSCFALENLYLLCTAFLISFPAVVLSFRSTTNRQVIAAVTILTLLLLFIVSSGRFYLGINTILKRLNRKPLEAYPSGIFGLKLALNYLLLWLVYGVAGSLLTDALFNVSPRDYILIGSAFVASWLGGFLSFMTPGGLGVREGLLVFFLLPVVSAAEASLVAVVARIIWTVAELGLSLAVAIFVHRYRDN